jgi:hypothetical protein
MNAESCLFLIPMHRDQKKASITFSSLILLILGHSMFKNINLFLLYLCVFISITELVNQDIYAQKKKKKNAQINLYEQTQLNTSISKESNLIINRFISTPKIISYMVITDIEGAGAKVRIQIYSENGQLRFDKYETLNPFGKLMIYPIKLVNNEIMNGSIRIFTEDGKIVGQYWQFYNETGSGYKNTALQAADGKGSAKILCQHFISNPEIESYLTVSNIEREKPTVINITYYSNEGAIISTQRKVLQPNGCMSIEPFKDIGKTINGFAVIESEMDNMISGEYWQLSNKEKYQIALPMEGLLRFK